MHVEAPGPFVSDAVMRPASSVRSPLLAIWVALTVLLSAVTAHADAEARAAEARFVDASFERMLEELGLRSDHEQTFPGSTRRLCVEMCERFRAEGLTPSVDCSVRCDRDVPAPSVQSQPALSTPPVEEPESEPTAGALPVIHRSCNRSREVAFAAVSENSQRELEK